ncbi:hypothetical protein [Methylocucumis oryzae]|uniref:Uncharacterized protein n=1 Tax=Methylocucumis oryzae TaxID=1632867 RepID=A0A0F3IF96_9GAMM|nr:hypothetical protein [Methylocucumis oryzae]KJV05495.1 hypothetical protein VZ94_17760 [Methylocucumis oryzae]
MNSTKELLLIERLKRHPKLFNRMEALLDVVENVTGDCTKADAAESDKFLILALAQQHTRINKSLHHICKQRKELLRRRAVNLLNSQYL